MKRIKLLVAEDDLVDRMAFERFVRRERLPYDYTFADSVAEARAALAREIFDAVIVDYLLADGTALDLLQEEHDVPIIVVTGSGNEEIAVRAMKAGAYDYLIKGAEDEHLRTLPVTLEQVLRRRRAEEELRWYRERLEDLVARRTAELRALNEKLRAEIAERERVEQELIQREELLHTLLNAMPDIVCFKDGEGRWLEANAADLRLFELEGVDYRGKTDAELAEYSPFYRDAFLTCMATDEKAWQRRTLSRGEERIPSPNGEEHIYDVIKVPIFNPDGTRKGLLVLGRDITEQKKVEKALRQQERLAAVGQLAGGIAHDFNNFLTIVSLYAQMPLRRHKHLPPDVVHSLQVIIEESKRAARLVQQILDFSRHATIQAAPMDLRAFVKEAVHVLQSTIPENISVMLEIEPGEYTVNAEPIRIQQVLINLALNARDAMPNGGKLLITLSQEPFDEQRYDISVPPPSEKGVEDWACLAVTDTGTGIPEEALPHIFEPFFTTKPVGQGTGLGLAQVYGIVIQHGGGIGVKTKEGQGTTFRIYLPLHRKGEESLSPSEQAEEIPQGKGETILLVEDNAHVREVGRRMLESLGYRVLTAANGREAMELCRAGLTVDLVFTDAVMPEMAGLELIRELRTMRPSVRVLVTTGHTLEEEATSFREAGAFDIVYKPFDMKALAHAVHRALTEGTENDGEP